jgi:hypothetical protein
VLAGRAAQREADPGGVGPDAPARRVARRGRRGVDALPDDLEVHQELPVRAKLVRIHRARPRRDALGPTRRLVAAVADDDRVAAKLLMHLALSLADGDGADRPSSPPARSRGARRRTTATSDAGSRGPTSDAVLEAVLVEQEDAAPRAVAAARAALDAAREEAGGADGDLGAI